MEERTAAKELRKCSQCNYSCIAQHSLKRHIIMCHSSGEHAPKQCKKCATQPSNSVPCSHTSEPLYECNGKLIQYEDLCSIAKEQKLEMLPGNEIQNEDLITKFMPSSSFNNIEPDVNTSLRLNHFSFSAEDSRRDKDHSLVQLKEEVKGTSHSYDCSFSTPNPDGMRKHKFSKEAQGENAFNCTQCDFSSVCQSTVQSHMFIHSAQELRKCSQCDYSCIAEYSLKRHIDMCHNSGEKTLNECKECAAQPSSSVPCSHTKEPPYKCTQCSYSTDQRWNLYRHTKSRHSAGELLKCPKCYYTCKMPGTMNTHMSRHTDNSHQCGVCSKVFTKANDLKIHLRSHTGEHPYKCTHCEYSSAQRISLSRHVLVHAEEKAQKCTECDFVTKDANTLKSHMYQHTGGLPKPFRCEICSTAFSEKAAFKRHQMVHTGNKTFKCTLCPYSSVQESYLASHMVKHTSERLFKCDKCDYAGASAALLKAHAKKHTGVKPKKCPECEYTCRDTGNLRKHMWIHSGVRPLQCPECPYACRDRSALKTHIARHSKDAKKE